MCLATQESQQSHQDHGDFACKSCQEQNPFNWLDLLYNVLDATSTYSITFDPMTAQKAQVPNICAPMRHSYKCPYDHSCPCHQWLWLTPALSSLANFWWWWSNTHHPYCSATVEWILWWLSLVHSFFYHLDPKHHQCQQYFSTWIPSQIIDNDNQPPEEDETAPTPNMLQQWNDNNKELVLPVHSSSILSHHLTNHNEAHTNNDDDN